MKRSGPVLKDAIFVKLRKKMPLNVKISISVIGTSLKKILVEEIKRENSQVSEF